MKLALCALGISIAICSTSTIANSDNAVKSAKNVAETTIKGSVTTTTNVVAKNLEKNFVKTEMQKMKEAMAILRTTQDNELAWDAIIDLRFATVELLENIPVEIQSDTSKKEAYIAVLKKLEALTVEVEGELNKSKSFEIQTLLDQIDKVKIEGHQLFKK